LNTYILQGSAATDLRGGGSFNSTFHHRSLFSSENLWNSVNFCRSFCRNKRWSTYFFATWCMY